MDLKITVMASLGGKVYFEDGLYYIMIVLSVDTAKMNLLIILFNFSLSLFIREGVYIRRMYLET